ncbi:MAG TPA: hypothetical protein VL096_02685 [Pirellulaceae bacterium]|nr:hypothetical protein [Pirellulaceae bacterium]
MARLIVTACLIVTAWTALVSSACAGDHYWGLGWTDKYYSTGGCPGFVQGRPLNPFLAVPLHSSYGQTGARRLMLFPPTYGSPLYNNSPRLAAYPPDMRKNPACLGPHCGDTFFLSHGPRATPYADGPYAAPCAQGIYQP